MVAHETRLHCLEGSWFRISCDAHQAVGIYSALFLFIAALKGVLVERADLIVKLTNSPEPLRFPQLYSGDAAGASPISVDRAKEIARTLESFPAQISASPFQLRPYSLRLIPQISKL